MTDDVMCFCGASAMDHGHGSASGINGACTNTEAALLRCALQQERNVLARVREREEALHAENAALRDAADYVLRVGAIDPDTPPWGIYEAAWGESAEGRHERFTTANKEWDGHMKVLKGER